MLKINYKKALHFVRKERETISCCNVSKYSFINSLSMWDVFFPQLFATLKSIQEALFLLFICSFIPPFLIILITAWWMTLQVLGGQQNERRQTAFPPSGYFIVLRYGTFSLGTVAGREACPQTRGRGDFYQPFGRPLFKIQTLSEMVFLYS